MIESVQTERIDEAGAVIEEDACARCETCRARAAGHCNRCYQACGNCVETLSFVIPELTSGDTVVVVTNRTGSTEGMSLSITSESTGTTGTTSTPTPTTGTASPTTGTTP